MLLRLIKRPYCLVKKPGLFYSSSKAQPLSDSNSCLSSYWTSRFPELSSLKLNDSVHGFKVLQVEPISDYDLVLVRLEHEETGAKYLHVCRDDQNNVFSVSFPTFPKDSTGVPHILEHTTLCGSEKYPVRDPFFKMLNRSLSTFMNAWTAPDYTMYPFSSQNLKDYENLRDVYMNATLRPMLNEMDFRQEGWRLEHQDVKDKSTPIIFKGVVYNEMKGAMSDIESLFCTRLQQHLFPNTTLEHNSGGDPAKITDLTHEQLVSFHRTHYHPSNAYFFTYGNFPLLSNLSYVNGEISSFGKRDNLDITDGMDNFEPYPVPRTVVEECPPDPMGDPEKQTKMIVSFLTHNPKDELESFTMRILAYLLFEGPSSPMYKALIDTNIGSDYAPGTGYDASTKVATLSVGLQGIKFEDTGKVEEIIFKVLEQCEKDGFWAERIDAAIHLIELGKKHRTGKFGMGLAQSIVPGWLRSIDPTESLRINKTIEKFKDALKNDPNFLTSRIRKYCLDNPHKLTFVMKPSSEHSERLTKEEDERLSKKLASLGSEELEKVYEDGIKLAEKQEEKEDLSCLPTLKVSDLERFGKKYPLDHSEVSGVPVQWRLTPTNGLSYFHGVNSLHSIPSGLKLYLPLLADTLTELGVAGKSMDQFQQDIEVNTGGLSVGMLVSSNYADLNEYENAVSFDSHCLDRNIPRMYDLFVESLTRTNFENHSRLKTLILSSSCNMTNSIVEAGHSFAKIHAASHLLPSLAHSEVYSGLTQIAFLESLAKSEDMASIVEKLKRIVALVFESSSLRLAVNCQDVEIRENNTKHLDTFVRAFNDPSNASTSSSSTLTYDAKAFEAKGKKTFFSIPFPINFASKVVKTVPYMHEDSSSLQILANIMSHKFLHREIREKNGAYGGGCSFSALDGLFSFYSYRDPNAIKSLESFGRAVEWAIRPDTMTDDDLTEAKLSIFSALDAPVDAANEGMAFFHYGLSETLRQERRENLLSVSLSDVKKVASLYLLNPAPNDTSSTVLGDESNKESQEALAKDGFELKAISNLYSNE